MNEVPVSISPSGPVTVAAGSTRQFSANVGARGVAIPERTIATDECAIRSEWTSVLIFTKSDVEPFLLPACTLLLTKCPSLPTSQ